jgi:monodehydroascorbate reductase (NADH)
MAARSASGDIISYEKLVIATGARSTTLADFKTPGSDLEGLFYLRNEADAAALFKAIEATKASGGKVRKQQEEGFGL